MAQYDDALATPFGRYSLSRYSRSQSRAEGNLRPWDAADELLLQHLSEQGVGSDARLLIANDQYGALVTALHHWQRAFCSDSFISTRAARRNLEANGLEPESVQWCDSLTEPSGHIDWLLIKVPKTLALLEDQLYRYRALCGPDTQVVVAGMVKHMSPALGELLEHLIGPTERSLACRKARLLFARIAAERWSGHSPYPSEYRLKHPPWTISNHANVFSRTSLDVGSRFFIEHLPRSDQALDIVDLGCGNGLIGMMAAHCCPGATLHFRDESVMAVASAEHNFRRYFDGRAAQFTVADGLAEVAPGSVDLILNNPPFHQGNVVGDFVARQMFRDARRALRPGGELYVIGNRHLKYHEPLRRHFGHCELLASNRKFVILKAIRH